MLFRCKLGKQICNKYCYTICNCNKYITAVSKKHMCPDMCHEDMCMSGLWWAAALPTVAVSLKSIEVGLWQSDYLVPLQQMGRWVQVTALPSYLLPCPNPFRTYNNPKLGGPEWFNDTMVSSDPFTSASLLPKAFNWFCPMLVFCTQVEMVFCSTKSSWNGCFEIQL